MQAQQRTPRAPRLSGASAGSPSSASSATASAASSPGTVRMRSLSGRLLTASERQAILRRFKSVSQDHLLSHRSHILARSSQQHLLRPGPATGAGATTTATAMSTATRIPSFPARVGAAPDLAAAAAVGNGGPPPPGTGAAAGGGGTVIGRRRKPAMRHNKSDSALATVVHSKALASARRRRGVAEPSPLKFAAERAMSRRQLSPGGSGGGGGGGDAGGSSTHLTLARVRSSRSMAGSAVHTGGGCGGAGGGDGGDVAAAAAVGGDAVDSAGTSNDEGVGGAQHGDSQSLAWLSPDDIEQRKVFLAELIHKGLPLPRSELDYHAARVFIDVENRSVYDLEQWMDFVQLTNRFTPQQHARGGGGSGRKGGVSGRGGGGAGAAGGGKDKWVDTPKCEVCRTRFWILRQRHHCRCCGRCVCWECSPTKFVLRGLYDNKPVRTCVDCYGELEDELLEETRYYIDLVRHLQHRIDTVMAASRAAATPEEARPHEAVMDEYLKLGQSIIREIGELEALHQKYWLRSHKSLLPAADGPNASLRQPCEAWAYASASPQALPQPRQPALPLQQQVVEEEPSERRQQGR